jgi:site-specific DNA-cytosine methylase
MKKGYQDIISSYLGVEPIEINSALVSAQNRRRLYWTNIGYIEQPEDRGLLIKDILQTERIEEKYYLRSKAVAGAFAHKERHKEKGNGFGVMLRNGDEKHSSLLSRDYKGAKDVLCVAMRGRHIIDGKRADYKGAPTEQRLEPNMNNKTNCLTTVGKDNLVLNKREYKLRRLTPVECERLQTVPDGYTDHVSNTQRYRMLGNGWTVDVIAHILNGFDIL